MPRISPGSRQRPRPYQFALRTGKPADAVLAEIAERQLTGITVAERGAHYLVLRPRSRRRYSGEVAVVLSVAVILIVLILSAVSVVLIALLPLAVVPAVPFLFEHQPDLAISAVPDEDGGTRVTVHGEASASLAAGLDAYLGSLPRLAVTSGVASREAG